MKTIKDVKIGTVNVPETLADCVDLIGEEKAFRACLNSYFITLTELYMREWEREDPEPRVSAFEIFKNKTKEEEEDYARRRREHDEWYKRKLNKRAEISRLLRSFD